MNRFCSGRERLVADVDLSASAEGVSGFSLHPDGTRLVTSVRVWPSDSWMLGGFNRRLASIGRGISVVHRRSMVVV
jgi:hypothetical protein